MRARLCNLHASQCVTLTPSPPLKLMRLIFPALCVRSQLVLLWHADLAGSLTAHHHPCPPIQVCVLLLIILCPAGAAAVCT